MTKPICTHKDCARPAMLNKRGRCFSHTLRHRPRVYKKKSRAVAA